MTGNMQILANLIKKFTTDTHENIKSHLTVDNLDEAKEDLDKFQVGIKEALTKSNLMKNIQMGLLAFDILTDAGIENMPQPSRRLRETANDPMLVKMAYMEAKAMRERALAEIKDARQRLKQNQNNIKNVSQAAIDKCSNNENTALQFNNTTNDSALGWSSQQQQTMRAPEPDIQGHVINPTQQDKTAASSVSTVAWGLIGKVGGDRGLHWSQDNAMIADGLRDQLQHSASVPPVYNNDPNNHYFNRTPDKNAAAQCGGRQGGPCYATSVPVIHKGKVNSHYCDMFGNEWEHVLPAGQYSAFFGTPIFGTLQKLIEDTRDIIGNPVSENFSQTFSQYGQMALQDSAIIGGVLCCTHKLFFLESAKVFNQAKCSKPLFLINSTTSNGVNKNYMMSVNSIVSEDIWKIMTTNNNYVCGAGNFVKDVNQQYINDKNKYTQNLQNLCNMVNSYWSQNSGFVYFDSPDSSYQLNNGTVSFLSGALYSGSLAQLLGIGKSNGQIVANQVHNFFNTSYENRLRHITGELLKIIEETIRQAASAADQVIIEDFEAQIQTQVDEAAKSIEDTIKVIKEHPEIEQKFREWHKANLIDDEELENWMSANDDSYIKYERCMEEIEIYAAFEEDKDRQADEERAAMNVAMSQLALENARQVEKVRAAMTVDEIEQGNNFWVKVSALPEEQKQSTTRRLKEKAGKTQKLSEWANTGAVDENARKLLPTFGTRKTPVDHSAASTGEDGGSGKYHGALTEDAPSMPQTLRLQRMHGAHQQETLAQRRIITQNHIKALHNFARTPEGQIAISKLYHCTPGAVTATGMPKKEEDYQLQGPSDVKEWSQHPHNKGGGGCVGGALETEDWRGQATLEDVLSLGGNMWSVKGVQFRASRPEEALIEYNYWYAGEEGAKVLELKQQRREQKWKLMPDKYSEQFVTEFNEDGKIPQHAREKSAFEEKLLKFLREEWYNSGRRRHKFNDRELDTFAEDIQGWPRDRRGAHLLRMKIQQIWIEVKQEHNQSIIQNKQNKINTYNNIHEYVWSIFPQTGRYLDELTAHTGIPQHDLYNYIITKAGADIDAIPSSLSTNFNLDLMMNNFKEIYSRKLKTPEVMNFIKLDGVNYSVKYLDDINKLSNTILEYIGYLNDSQLNSFQTHLMTEINSFKEKLEQRKPDLGLGRFTEEDNQKFFSYIPLLEPIYKKVKERVSKLKTENEKKIAMGEKTKKDKLYSAIYKYLDLKIGGDELPFLFNKLHAYKLPLKVIEMGEIPIVNLKRDAESAELTEYVKNKKKVSDDIIPYIDFSSDELDNISKFLEEKKKKEVEIPNKDDKYSKIEITLKKSVPENMDINEDHILLIKKFLIQLNHIVNKIEKDEVSHKNIKYLKDAFDKITDDIIISSRQDISNLTREVSAAVSEPDDPEPLPQDETTEDYENKYTVNQIEKIISYLHYVSNILYNESNKNTSHSVSSSSLKDHEILQLNKDMGRNFNITEEAKILDKFQKLLFEVCYQIFNDNEIKKHESENKCEYPTPSNFFKEGISTGGGDIPEDTLVDITAIIGNTNKVSGYFLIMLLKSGSELNTKKVKLFLSNYHKFKNIEEQHKWKETVQLDLWEDELEDVSYISGDEDLGGGGMELADLIAAADVYGRELYAPPDEPWMDREAAEEIKKREYLEARAADPFIYPGITDPENQKRLDDMFTTKWDDYSDAERDAEQEKREQFWDDPAREKGLAERAKKNAGKRAIIRKASAAAAKAPKKSLLEMKGSFSVLLPEEKEINIEELRKRGNEGFDERMMSFTAEKYDNFNEYSVIDQLSLIWNADKITVNDYNEINNYINDLIYQVEAKISEGISGDTKDYIIYFFNVIRGNEIFKLFTNEININDKEYELPELYDTPILDELDDNLNKKIWDLSYPGIYLEEEITTSDVLFKKGFVESVIEIKKKVIDLLYINLYYFIFDNIENNITFKKFKEIKKQNNIYYENISNILEQNKKRIELFEEYTTQNKEDLLEDLRHRKLPHNLIIFNDDEDYVDQMIMVLVDYDMAQLYPNLPSPKTNSEITDEELTFYGLSSYDNSERNNEVLNMKTERIIARRKYNEKMTEIEVNSSKNISPSEVEKAENNFEKSVLGSLRLSMDCMLEYYSHKSKSSGFSQLIVSDYHKADTNSDYLYRKYFGDNTYRLVLSYFKVKSIIKDKLVDIAANAEVNVQSDWTNSRLVELLPVPYKNINREPVQRRRRRGESIYSPLYNNNLYGGAGEDEELKDIIETTIFHCINGWPQLPEEGEEELGRGGIKDEIYGRFKDELYMVDLNFTKYLILLKDILENEAKSSGRSFKEFKGWIEREEMELLNKEAESEAKEKADKEEAHRSQGEQRLTTVKEEVEPSEDDTSTPVQDTQMSSPLKTEGNPQEPKKAWKEDDWRVTMGRDLAASWATNLKPTEAEVAEQTIAAEASVSPQSTGFMNLFDATNEAQTLKNQIEEARLQQPGKVKELEQKYEEARTRYLGLPSSRTILEESSPEFNKTWGEWATSAASGFGNWLSGNQGKGKGGGKNRRSRKRTPKKQRRSLRKRTPKQRRSSRKRTPKQRRSSRRRTSKQKRSSRRRTPKQKRSSRRRTPKHKRSLNKRK